MKIEEILNQYNIKTNHAMQVKVYALMLFEAMSNKLFETGEKEAKYLEYAALLHDIGYFIESKSHHKHTLDLILGLDLDDCTKEEVQIIAHIARYHRSSFPDETKHKRFSELNGLQKKTVLRLAPILRLADGLDDPHKNLITGVEVEMNEDDINILIRTVGFLPKLETAQNKKDLLEEIFAKPVKLICKRA